MTKYLIIMIFLHIVDDFYLQGILSKLKQKQWWEHNYPQELYKNDYRCSMIAHGFSWTFMIMLTWALFFTIDANYYILFIANMIIHIITDDLKANKKMINLCQDQVIHLLQIFVTWWLMTYIN